jgi:hypothetical protein
MYRLLRHAGKSEHIMLSVAIVDDGCEGDLCSGGTSALLLDIK